MKSLLLAGAMIVATGTCALAQGGYWVVGNRATRRLCEDLPGHASSRSSVHTSSSATRTRDDDVVSQGLREAVLARFVDSLSDQDERAETLATLVFDGQGANAFGAAWYVMSPAGNAVTTSASSSSGGGGGY